MKSFYEIVDFTFIYLDIYKKCFSNPHWTKLYGFDFKDFNLDNYINSSVLKNYPTVERLIVLNKKHEPILFAHLCKEQNDCIIVGGLIPELLNSGQGIFCSLIIFDYALKQRDINSITVSILNNNFRSLKMVRKFGFKETKQFENEKNLKIILSLHKVDYPNTFSKTLLSKLEYAKM